MSASNSMPTAPPLLSLRGMLLWVAAILLVAASFISLQLEWRTLLSAEAVRSASEFLHGFMPPDLTPALLRKIGFATLETLAMSALGTALATVFGLLLALPASGRFGPLARASTRLLLNILRAVPELVWASIMLIAAGLGPFAGTIALAAHTSGVLGRLFAETLENLPPACATSLRLNGASATQAFLYASLPQALPQMLSYTLYRWENNIRAAAILGVVGAGGLGQMLKYHLSLFQMPTAASVILAMLLLVAVVDALSFAIRKHLTQ
ncbi:phosphonate ABC transporter, permease protein PhnE [Undibacterium sp. CCC3.4]|uniref:phosphonate ABC transporter, permease protein PhnE n=3 Tax=Undibacterium TaxID=401469 RepID=UPI003A1024EE